MFNVKAIFSRHKLIFKISLYRMLSKILLLPLFEAKQSNYIGLNDPTLKMG